jgi:hypothetical protein
MSSLRLTREVRLRLVRGPRRTARASPPTRVEERISTSRRNNSWRPCRRPTLARALMQVWPAARPSHRHHLPLCHTRLSLRHSSTLYDAHKPRLRLGRGKLGKYSGRLRQAQTTRGEGQASRSKQSNPATRRPPYKASRVGFNAPRRTAMYDGTCQLPSTVTLFYFPLCPSPCDYKRERRETVTRVRPP